MTAPKGFRSEVNEQSRFPRLITNTGSQRPNSPSSSRGKADGVATYLVHARSI